MRARFATRVAAAVLAALMTAVATASLAAPTDTIYVVVSAQSSVHGVTEKDLLALYTGRTRTLPTGNPATPLDQEHDGPARAFFYQALTGMDIARINSYWARLRFTGQVQPPQIVGEESAMVQRVRADPSAIGYLTQPPADASLRVVLRLP